MKKRQSPFLIRTAEPTDLEQATLLALQIPRENNEMFSAPNPVKVAEMLATLIANKTLIVYENNGVICGLLGVKIDSFWWSDTQVMTDVLFYIKPEFRSFSAYKRMLQAAEEFAKINKVPLALLFLTTKDVDKKYQMILRRGYNTIGFWVMKT